MIDSRTMMALGDYRFSIDTAAYQRLERRSSWRWQAVDRLGARPAMQFIGSGEDSISMDGTVFPSYAGGLGQVEAMRKEADRGEPLMLVSGAGRVWGKFCITEISETHEVFFSDGTPRRIDFSLNLVMYGGEDDANEY